MGRNYKFKEGDKVKVIATKEQLKEIGIGKTWDDKLFNKEIYEKTLVVKRVKNYLYVLYLLNNDFYFLEEHLDYAD